MRWPWTRKTPALAAHLRAGLWGEDHALRHLKKKGFKILGTRVRMGRRDELDIVARHQDVLVFVEVKTRASEVFGRPASAVNWTKRRALSRAAIRYMHQLKQRPAYFRFDVVEVVGSEGSAPPEVRHLENAFTLDKRYRIRW